MSKRFAPRSFYTLMTTVSTKGRFRNLCEEVARCQEHSQYQPGNQSCDTGKDDPEGTAGFDGALSGDRFCDSPVGSIGDHRYRWSLAAGLLHQVEVVLQRLVDLGVLDPGQGAICGDDLLQFCLGLVTEGVCHRDVGVQSDPEATVDVKADRRGNRLQPRV